MAAIDKLNQQNGFRSLLENWGVLTNYMAIGQTDEAGFPSPRED